MMDATPKVLVLVLGPIADVQDAVLAALRDADQHLDVTIADRDNYDGNGTRDHSFDVVIADAGRVSGGCEVWGDSMTGAAASASLILVCGRAGERETSAADAILHGGATQQYIVATPNALRALPTVVRRIVRQQGEQEALKRRFERLARARKVMARCNKVLVRATQEAELLEEMCRIVVECGQYPGVWIGLLEAHDGVIVPVASAGRASPPLGGLYLGAKDDSFAPTDACVTLSQGKECIVRDGDAACAVAVLPMIAKDGATFGALAIFGSDPESFDAEEMEMLEELVGDISYGMHSLRAKSQLQEVLEGLRKSEARFVQLASHIREVFFLMSASTGETVYISPAYEEIWGRSCESLYANPTSWLAAVHPRDRSRVAKLVEQARTSGRFDDEYRVVRPDGSERWVHARGLPVYDPCGRLYRIAGVTEDITERKEQEARLEHLSYHDGLTNLANRALLNDRVEQLILHARRDKEAFALIFVDLDQFKEVNDGVGHEVGDQVLVQTSSRLMAAVRAGDTVARHGGDEFVVAAPCIRTEDEAAEFALRMLAALSQPLQIGEQEIYIGASMGIAFYPKDGESVSDLLRNADAAMLGAKKTGGEKYRFYDAEINARRRPRLKLASSLRRALEQNDFILHYQPEVEVATGRTIGFEALLRWQHRTEGLLLPAAFIGMAEESGLISPLGEWVLRDACRQMKSWSVGGVTDQFVAVNLSAHQFRGGDLVKVVESALSDSGLSAQNLELELTESMVMEDPVRSSDIVRKLRELGVRISLDDFGTGYSSLAYLKRFAIDKLKIDRSFVSDITRDVESATIATAIIAMAHRLRLKVVAEGVETEAQFGYLRQHHCNFAQGYLFSAPVPPNTCAGIFAQPYALPAAGSASNTLLVVDDEAGILAAVKRVLRREGYTLLTASSASEAFDLLARHPVGVILSDQRMPVMSGIEFLSRVSELYPDSVRVVLSGYTDLDSVTEAVNRGAIYKFLTKPWDDDGLRGHISDAFRHYRMSHTP